MISSKNLLTTFSLIAVLLLSGTALPARATQSSGRSFAPHAPTYVGTASKFLTGPTAVTPSFGTSGETGPSSSSRENLPTKNPRPFVGNDPSPPVVPFPSVSCIPPGPSCDTISSTADGATTNPIGLHASDSASLYPSIGDVEPPDQGLCTGNGFVIEALNLGELRIYDTSLTAVSGVVSLDSLMGLPP